MIRLIAGLFSFVALAAIAGIAGVGLVVWMYGRDLPGYDSLANYQPSTLSRVYSGEGRLIAEFAQERRIFAPIDEIPALVKQAFISAEDKNFYSHPGIDATGILRAVLANAQALRSGDGRLQGASTITQQVMKNFLLTSDRSIERKIKEAILSLRIERALSKDRILELYLNEIFLGQNAYGVAAAAQRYFGVTLEDLTLAQAAYLAALPKAPSDLHPVRQHARAVERRNYVLRQMFENGVISEIDMQIARIEPLATLFDGGVETQVAVPDRPNHFTEEVRRVLTARMGSEAVLGGGLTVRATIDPALQEVAAAALRRQLLDYDRAQGGYGGPVAQLVGLDLGDEAAWRAALAATPAPRDVPDWR
ncbi:MAG: penicillin-binding protein, partial [Alphaproteobacteria bacterium HGW-Alphaproteobacteria-8]